MDVNETTELADLTLTNGQQEEVKGGLTTSTTVKINGNLQIADLTSVAIDP